MQLGASGMSSSRFVMDDLMRRIESVIEGS